jgi:hypothetical protein
MAELREGEHPDEMGHARRNLEQLAMAARERGDGDELVTCPDCGAEGLPERIDGEHGCGGVVVE